MMNHILPDPAASAQQTETILTNAEIVLPDRVVHGTIVLRGGLIDDIAEGRSHAPGAIDLAGDTLIPGIIDLHTDNLERQREPRPGARWPSRPALIAHDAQCAAAGVTTVFDALCVGDLGLGDGDRVETFHDGARDLEALSGTKLLRVSHFLHLRCELPAPDMLSLLEVAMEHPLLRMASLMDHTPGVGQYADVARYRGRRIRGGMMPDDVDAHIEMLLTQRETYRADNRRQMLAMLRHLGIVLASHDDETLEEVETNHADGIRISEFPVRLEAAKRAKALGMDVIAGAPNLVRGGSHSGNVSAAEMLEAGAVDILASDYVPPSLLEASFALADQGMPLPQAIALVSEAPARVTGLTDRGRIEPGLRADLAAIHRREGLAAPVAVWSAGRRVA